MFRDNEGPIEKFEWGMFTIAGIEHSDGRGAGKDVRLVGAEVSAWTERKGHDLSSEMITGIYDKDIEILLVGTGVYQKIQCPESLKLEIRAHGVSEIRLLATPDACKAYNQMHRQGRRVALLAHGTC